MTITKGMLHCSQILIRCSYIVELKNFMNRTFQETFSSLKPEYPWKTRLSSAGLVYVHFGEEVLSNLMGVPKDSEIVTETYKKIYENFIEEMVIYSCYGISKNCTSLFSFS